LFYTVQDRPEVWILFISFFFRGTVKTQWFPGRKENPGTKADIRVISWRSG